MITQSDLKDQLRYNPRTGEFRWLRGGRFNRLAGKSAGYRDPDGYLLIRIGGVLYQAHRLAWLYMTGNWPNGGFIDHRNTDPSDNRWVNLGTFDTPEEAHAAYVQAKRKLHEGCTL